MKAIVCLICRSTVVIFLFALCACAPLEAQPPFGMPDAQFDPTAVRIQQCIQTSLGNPLQAIEEAKSILTTENLPSPPRLGALNCLGHAQAMTGDIAGATTTVKQMSALTEKTPMPDVPRAANLSGMADILQQTGDVKQAAKLFQQAYDLSKDKDAPPVEIGALVGLGRLYGDLMGDPVSAEPYIRKAYELSKQKLGRDDMFLAFNLAYNQTQLRHFKEAMAMMDHVLQLAGEDEKFLGVRYRANTGKARIFFEEHQPQEALKLVDASIAGQRQVHDLEGEAVSQLLLAEILMSAQQYDQARPAAKRVLEIGEQLHKEQIKRDALHRLAAIEEASGHEKDAQTLKQKAGTVDEALAKVQASTNPSQLGSQLRDRAARGENTQLQKQVERQDQQVRRSQMFLRLSIAALVLVVLLGGGFVLYQRRVSRRLHTLSTTDALTGLINRREAMRVLGGLQRDAQAGTRSRAALLLIDADNFKSINDRYGHEAGDVVLKELSARIRSLCRPEDLVARWGGEEFLVGARNINFAEAEMMAERLRAAIEAEPVDLQDGTFISVAISIGFAMYPFFRASEEETWRKCVYLADCALYAAKNSGRDIWVGLEGIAEATNTSIQQVSKDIEFAIERGWITASSNKPLTWQAVPTKSIQARKPLDS